MQGGGGGRRRHWPAEARPHAGGWLITTPAAGPVLLVLPARCLSRCSPQWQCASVRCETISLMVVTAPLSHRQACSGARGAPRDARHRGVHRQRCGHYSVLCAGMTHSTLGTVYWWVTQVQAHRNPNDHLFIGGSWDAFLGFWTGCGGFPHSFKGIRASEDRAGR